MNLFVKFFLFIVSIPARIKGMRFGKNSYIGPGHDLFFVRLRGVIFGNDVIIGKCLISYNVSIIDHDHVLYEPNVSPLDSGLTEGDEIIIGDECFIGAHSFILKGVKLGNHCVVGANSVLTNSFLAYSVLSGNPAKLIRKFYID